MRTRTRTRVTRRGRLFATGLMALLAVTAVVIMTRGQPAAHFLATTPLTKAEVVEVFAGEATFYGPGLPSDAVTASGAPFDPQAATAAHPTLPFGTILRVSRPGQATAVTVEVNDRLPEADQTRIDLTVGAARQLGMLDEGRIPVQVEVLAQTDR